MTIKQIETITNSHELFLLINEYRVEAGVKPYRNHADLVVKIKKELCSDLHGHATVTMQGATYNGGFRKFDAYVLSEDEVKSMFVREGFTGTRLARLYGERESGALSAIEQILNINLIRQYRVLGYRLDGYCKETNTAYEVDEEQHFLGVKLRKECIDRQALIEKELGCTFVRIKV